MILELRLHGRQSRAFSSEATEILYGGAAGGGKSHLLRVAAIAWCAAIPGLQVYLFRRTFPDLMKNHMEGPAGFPSILAPWVEEGKSAINYSKNYIEIGKSRIHLCHCQHEKDIYKYQGAEIHVLLLDELTHFTKTQYTFLRSRVRMAGLDVPEDLRGRFPRIICASNPGGVGHNWVKTHFVDFATPMEPKRAEPKDGGMLRQYIPAKLADNPTLERDDPHYAEKLMGMGNRHLVEAMLGGNWDIVAGGMFDDVWNRDIHVVKPFEIPSSWRIDRAFDYGSSKPFSVGWWAESDGTGLHYPRGTLFRIGEWYGCTGEPNEGLKLPVADIASGIVEREDGMGIRERCLPGPGDCIPANPGEVSMRDALADGGARFETPDKSSGSRRAGWQLFRDRLTASAQDPMESPGVFVFDNCKDFIRTVPVLPRSEREPDDVDTNAEDHIADETRYRLLHKRAEAAWIRRPW